MDRIDLAVRPWPADTLYAANLMHTPGTETDQSLLIEAARSSGRWTFVTLGGIRPHRLVVYVAAWLPAALTALYLKYVILSQGGFLVVSRSAGKLDGLSLLERMTFFQSDVFMALVVAPLVILAGCHVLRPRWRGMFVSAVSIAFVLLFYGNMQSYGNIGRSLSMDLLWDAVQWGTADTTYIREYIEPDGFMKLVALVGLIVSGAWWASRWDPDLHPDASPRAGHLLLSALLIAAGCAAVPRAWSTLPVTPYHDNILAASVADFFERAEWGRAPGLVAGEQGPFSGFQTLTRTPAGERDAGYLGQAAGHDVVLIILETAPSRALESDERLHNLPNLARLYRNAMVARQHYSTYPYSSQAHFSILSGMYPPEVRFAKLMKGFPDLKLPGLMRSLRRQGYQTASYSPYHSVVEPDEQMYQALGIDQQVIAEMLPGVETRDPEWCSGTRTLDVAALEQMKKAITQLVSQDRRFAAAFMPGIGHAPWCDVADNGANILARGRALIELQDAWIGEIVSLLEAHGRLDKTVIVITADHGIRTRQEDPSFKGGMIDEYSFRVPLVVFSQAAFPTTLPVPWVTSHIDIAPTILDLLNIDTGRAHEQGAPIWDTRLKSRVTYFLAKGYLGADGVHVDGRFSMVNHMSGAVYANDRMAFTAGDLVFADSSEREEIVGLIDAARPHMDSWLRAVIGHDAAASEPGSDR